MEFVPKRLLAAFLGVAEEFLGELDELVELAMLPRGGVEILAEVFGDWAEGLDGFGRLGNQKPHDGVDGSRRHRRHVRADAPAALTAPEEEGKVALGLRVDGDRKSTRLNSSHT